MFLFLFTYTLIRFVCLLHFLICTVHFFIELQKYDIFPPSLGVFIYFIYFDHLTSVCPNIIYIFVHKTNST